jgi:hypothetical protein
MSLNIIAWREILARVFADFTEQENVSPEWLVNPATRRRLKLDKFYPEAAIAVRFVGLTAKGQGRQSDWELLESEQRDETRAELCRLNGVQLVLIDAEEDPLKQMDALVRTLSRSSRMLAQSDRPARDKQRWMPALNAARESALNLRSRLAKNPAQMMANFAESWRDRELAFSSQAPPVALPGGAYTGPALGVGQRVRHERFGEGIITGLRAENSDAMLTILFDVAEERTFLASLVQDKLEVLR